MARLTPIEHFDAPTRQMLDGVLRGNFDEVPNSIGTLALRPPILESSVLLWQAVMGPGQVDRALKWMVGNIASKAHGCMYCAAHTVTGAGKAGVAADKLDALWSFESSALFDERERTALRFAFLGAQSPNGLNDSDFVEMKVYFSEPQIAEILAVVSVYGFFNRWNDSLATPLEIAPKTFAQEHLGSHGWEPGRHER
jgi:alkylhydroperoxidase family enzyme